MWEGAGGRRMDRHHPGSQAIGQIFGNWLPPALARQFSYFCGALFSHCVSFSLLLLLSLSLSKRRRPVFFLFNQVLPLRSQPVKTPTWTK